MRRFFIALLVCAAGARAETPKDTVVMAKPIDEVKDVEKLFGELAESWSVGPDGKTYTFKIRPKVKFHSGNPVTAEDAAFSYQRAVILNKTPAFILTQLGVTPQNAAQRIRAVD